MEKCWKKIQVPKGFTIWIMIVLSVTSIFLIVVGGILFIQTTIDDIFFLKIIHDFIIKYGIQTPSLVVSLSLLIPSITVLTVLIVWIIFIVKKIYAPIGSKKNYGERKPINTKFATFTYSSWFYVFGMTIYGIIIIPVTLIFFIITYLSFLLMHAKFDLPDVTLIIAAFIPSIVLFLMCAAGLGLWLWFLFYQYKAIKHGTSLIGQKILRAHTGTALEKCWKKIQVPKGFSILMMIVVAIVSIAAIIFGIVILGKVAITLSNQYWLSGLLLGLALVIIGLGFLAILIIWIIFMVKKIYAPIGSKKNYGERKPINTKFATFTYSNWFYVFGVVIYGLVSVAIAVAGVAGLLFMLYASSSADFTFMLITCILTPLALLIGWTFIALWIWFIIYQSKAIYKIKTTYSRKWLDLSQKK